MLSFMSPYKDTGKQVEDSSYYGPQGFNTYGIQTNEPALLYILSRYELEKYYFVPRETIVVESKAKNNESA